LVFAAVLIVSGVQLLALGLLGDLQVRNFQEPARRVPYTIAQVLRSRARNRLLTSKNKKYESHCHYPCRTAPGSPYGRLSGENAFEVLHKARQLEAQGRDIIHLEIGEPDFDTPANITEVGIQAIRDGHTHYTPSAGILELREAAAEDIRKTRGIPARPTR